jgi:NAD(P)-dependent dehydrogenase (short-subunit alcohol dehydrogenase family)
MKKTDNSITAVVIGAGKVWGEIIMDLLHENAMVIVPGRNSEEIKQLSNYITVPDKKLVTFLADISDYQRASRLLNDITAKYGKIDLAVAVFDNPKLFPDTLLIDLKSSEFERIVSDNIINYLIICQLMLHSMKKYGHGVYISVSNNSPEYENRLSRLTSFIEKVQVEMSQIFANEVASMGVKYYHLFTGDYIRPQNPPANEGNTIADITTIGCSVINLYKGRVRHPENIFQ